MPRQTYTDNLTAVDAGNLNHIEAQGNHVFATTAARNAAYPADSPPRDGEMCITGTDRNRTAWFWNDAREEWRQAWST